MQRTKSIFYFLFGFSLSLIVIISLFPFLVTPYMNEGSPVVIIRGNSNEYVSVSNVDIYNVLRTQDGTGRVVDLMTHKKILLQNVELTDVMLKEVDSRVGTFETYAIQNEIPISQHLLNNRYNSIGHLQLDYTVDALKRAYASEMTLINREDVANTYHPKIFEVIKSNTIEEANYIHDMLKQEVPVAQLKADKTYENIKFSEQVLFIGSKDFSESVLNRVFQLMKYEFTDPIEIDGSYYIFRLIENDSNSDKTIAKMGTTDHLIEFYFNQLLSRYSITNREIFR